MLKQKIILNYASNILLQFLQIVGSVVVARVAGAKVLGTVAFGTAYVSMFVFIADLGLGTAHIKLVSAADESDLNRYIGTFAVINLATTFLFMVVFLSFFIAQEVVFHHYFDETHKLVIYFSLGAISIQQLLSYQNATFAGKLEIAKQQSATVLKGFLYQLIRIGVVLMGFGAVAIAGGNLFSALILIPAYFYLFRNHKVGKFDKTLVKDYFSISIPVILIGLSLNMTHYLDKVFIEFFGGSADVGYYTAGLRFGGFIQLIGVVVASTLMPDFSRLFKEKDTAQIARKVYKYERFSYVFVMPIAILFAIESDLVVNVVLGHAFVVSIPVMQFSTLGLFLYVMGMPYGSIITGFGNFRLAAGINIVGLAVFLGLAASLPNPKVFGLGVTGMALSIATAYVVSSGLYKIFSRRYCKEIEHFVSLKYLGLGAVLFAVGHSIYTGFANSLLTKLVFPIAFLVATATIFRLFRMVNMEDLRTLKKTLNIKSTLRYIVMELKDSAPQET